MSQQYRLIKVNASQEDASSQVPAVEPEGYPDFEQGGEPAPASRSPKTMEPAKASKPAKAAESTEAATSAKPVKAAKSVEDEPPLNGLRLIIVGCSLIGVGVFSLYCMGVIG